MSLIRGVIIGQLSAETQFHRLGDHTDTALNNAAHNQTIRWNATLGVWESIDPQLLPSAPQTLVGLSDVNVSSPATNHVLRWNASTNRWENIAATSLPVPPHNHDSQYVSISAFNAQTLSAHADVNISSPATNHVLRWNASANRWENIAATSLPVPPHNHDSQYVSISAFNAQTLNAHADVNISSPATNHVLRWNASANRWENIAATSLPVPPHNHDDRYVQIANFNHSLSAHTDVNVSSPATNHVLRWNGSTGRWENVAATSLPVGPHNHDDRYVQIANFGHNLGSHSDVQLTTLATDHVLRWNASTNRWQNVPATSLPVGAHNHDSVYPTFSYLNNQLANYAPKANPDLTGRVVVSGSNAGYWIGGVEQTGFRLDTSNNMTTYLGGSLQQIRRVDVVLDRAGRSIRRRYVSSNVTLSPDDDIVTVDCDTGTRTITLPSATTLYQAFSGSSATGKYYYIMRQDANINNSLMIAPASGQSILLPSRTPVTTLYLTGRNAYVELVALSTTQWQVIDIEPFGETDWVEVTHITTIYSVVTSASSSRFGNIFGPLRVKRVRNTVYLAPGVYANGTSLATNNHLFFTMPLIFAPPKDLMCQVEQWTSNYSVRQTAVITTDSEIRALINTGHQSTWNLYNAHHLFFTTPLVYRAGETMYYG